MSGDLFRECCEFLVQYGYLPDDHTVDEWDDVELKSAIAAFQRADANVAIAKEQSGRGELNVDGLVGPATLYAMSLPRCACPDHAVEEATGRGGWKNCHGADDHHHCIVQVDDRRMPSFLGPHIKEILWGCREAYRKIGMLITYTNGDNRDWFNGDDVDGRPNSIASWQNGNGWIGLAIVGNSSNTRCSSQIWQKYDNRYRPSNIVREWTSLWMHEHGHNSWLGHTSGGHMNPSIINGLSPEWTPADPSYRTLVNLYSGEEVPLPGPDPEPPTPEPPNGPEPGQPLGEAFRMYDGTKAQLFKVFGSGS